MKRSTPMLVALVLFGSAALGNATEELIRVTLRDGRTVEYEASEVTAIEHVTAEETRSIFPLDPQKTLAGAIAEAIRLLEDRSFKEFAQKFIPPSIKPFLFGAAQPPEERMAAMRDELLESLRLCKGEPTREKSGPMELAVFELGGGKKVTFIREKGRWYLAHQEGVEKPAPNGSAEGDPTPDE